jgi:hypothetical protein
MPTPFWRSAETQQQLQQLDRPAFAMEFLRRNPAYRDDYNHIEQLAAQGAENVDQLRADFARRWGLNCPPRR